MDRDKISETLNYYLWFPEDTRDAEVGKILTWLHGVYRGESPALAIVGGPGTGKTAAIFTLSALTPTDANVEVGAGANDRESMRIIRDLARMGNPLLLDDWEGGPVASLGVPVVYVVSEEMPGIPNVTMTRATVPTGPVDPEMGDSPFFQWYRKLLAEDSH